VAAARIYVWLAAGKDLDDSQNLLPACGNRLCVNPDHLDAVRLVDLSPDGC
jgi:hypothetical protein